jgi:hypothetical protein
MKNSLKKHLATVIRNLGEAILMVRESKLFELKGIDFYLTSQKSGKLLSNGIFKTASNVSKTAFFYGLESRREIEIN